LPLLNLSRAIATVFRVVGFGLESCAANRAPFCGFITENIRFEWKSLFIFQQHPPEELAVDGIGNALNANAALAVVQQEAVAVVIVAADSADKNIGAFPLLRRQARERTVPPPFNRRQCLDIENNRPPSLWGSKKPRPHFDCVASNAVLRI
jgi:hypothetical protein